MDFMNVAEPHLDEDNITRYSSRVCPFHASDRDRCRLSNRLQRTDKSTIYDSYTRKSRLQHATGPSSPPTTPSSSTLTSLSSASFSLARSRRLRRSVSSVSTTSSMSVTSGSSAPLSVPRIQHIKSIRADIPPPPPPKDIKSPKLGSKRAPSYGALAQGTKEARIPVTHERRDSITSCASSDEEEKVRAERTKKQRTKASVTPVPINNPGGASPHLSSPSTPSKLVPSMPVLRESFAQNTGITISKMPSASTSPNRKLLSLSELSQDVTSPRIRQKKLPMNLQRNPSIFGEELPQATLMSPKHAMQPSATPPATPVTPASHPNSPSTTTLLSSAQASPSPSEMRRKTLRRVRRMGNGRRISFGSLLPITGNDDVDDNVVNADEEGSIKKISLGSAFQMH